MLLDNDLLFANDQAITATAVSETVLDLERADIGTGEPVGLYAQVTEAFADSVAGTLTVMLQDSPDNSAWSDLVEIEAEGKVKAELAAGTVVFDGYLPKSHDRYVRLNFVVAGGPFTAGKILAGLYR